MSAPNPFPAVFMLLGLSLLIGGIAWMYRPAGLIAAGLILTAFGFIGRRGTF